MQHTSYIGTKMTVKQNQPFALHSDGKEANLHTSESLLPQSPKKHSCTRGSGQHEEHMQQRKSHGHEAQLLNRCQQENSGVAQYPNLLFSGSLQQQPRYRNKSETACSTANTNLWETRRAPTPGTPSKHLHDPLMSPEWHIHGLPPSHSLQSSHLSTTACAKGTKHCKGTKSSGTSLGLPSADGQEVNSFLAMLNRSLQHGAIRLVLKLLISILSPLKQHWEYCKPRGSTVT